MNEQILKLGEQAELRCRERFREIDRAAEKNTERVLNAFRTARVSEACFAGTTGYGYDDLGRETLDRIFAELMGTETALVRIGFVNGTHALTAALFSLAVPGQHLLSATGLPYDTLQEALGIRGSAFGSLRAYGIGYDQVDLRPDGSADLDALAKAAAKPGTAAVILQRSRGYAERKALSVDEIGEIVKTVKLVNPEIAVMVDNCYGEFTDIREPGHVGADLMAGSLIKNPGGGLAPSGGYIAGRSDLVERAAMRLTTPGIGGECGASLGCNRLLFQGLFLAPHTTAQALKTAVFCAAMMEQIGIRSFPGVDDRRSDIIQTVCLGSEEKMRRFCKGIQKGAPVDSFVTPEPWAMPGYDDPVIMAAGSFIQGSSIELSADGPVRPPYDVFMQGGLTYESGKLGILMAVEELLAE
ncbi:MAG: aminotransferase class I/II-fold pyridoxal phosphate-dependent enzyme [Eubacteriales bacterium]|nr:methionine gamma-lyase family protein [Oscillospiraceae bacterium]MBQ1790889.1 methionine gamma-lyase family protein [Oscillospiraceae bacterium]MBQ2072808.1 methionine gamma-lyase family protein [Oscillospiraceae bacterium]MBQ4016511.1 methionine gamma-lyase family protein [Oscillospiraceae bacterium]MBQ5427667.1 methionine gamma-lyase family protein [Oscillospiraceae bacterium]